MPKCTAPGRVGEAGQPRGCSGRVSNGSRLTLKRVADAGWAWWNGQYVSKRLLNICRSEYFADAIGYFRSFVHTVT